MSESQKFIARNRAPRVQIEYDVELYGAEKKVQLPFVMGVMSDLSGKSEKPAVDQRKFLEIDVDNFDERMKAVAPKAQFTVPNTLTGEGSIAVDLTFESMADFGPEAIAAKVETLAPLLAARKQLSTLMAYMDGKAGAESLIEKILREPALLGALAGGVSGTDMEAALDTLRGKAPAAPEENGHDATLAALAAAAPQQSDEVDEKASVLDALKDAAPDEAAPEDGAADVLAGLAADAPDADAEVDEAADVLAGIARVETEADIDTTADVLAGLEAPEAPEPTDETGDVLSGIARVEERVEPDRTDDILGGIEAVSEADEDANVSDVLSGIEHVAEAAAPDDTTGDVLASIERVEDEAASDTTADVLAGLDAPEVAEPTDEAGDVLSGIARVEESVEADASADILGSIERVDTPDEVDATDDILAGLDAPEDLAAETSAADDALGSIELVAEEASDEDALEDVLSGIETVAEDEPDGDALDNVLTGLEPAPEAEGDDGTDDILAGLDAPEEVADTAAEDALASLEPVAEEASDEDALADVLSGIETGAEDEPDGDALDDVLAGLEPAPEASEEDALADVLGSIETAEDAPEAGDDLDDILAGVEAVEDTPEESGIDDVLSAVETADTDAAAQSDEGLDDILAGLDAPEDAEEPADLDGILADLEPAEAATSPEGGNVDHVLGGLEAVDDAAEGEDLDDILSGLEADTSDAPDEDGLEDVLGSLESPEAAEEEESLDDMLGGLDAVEEDGTATGDDLDDILGGLEAGTEAAPREDLDDILAGLEDTDDPADAGDATTDILAELSETPADDGELAGIQGDSAADNEGDDDLAALLGDLESDGEAVADDAEAAEDDDLAALLGDLAGDDDAVDGEDDASEDDDLSALLGDLEAEDDSASDEDDDLASLLGDLEADAAGEDDGEDAGEEAGEDDDLAALLGDLESDDETSGDAEDDLAALLGDLEGDEAEASEDTGADGGADGEDEAAEAAAAAPEEPVQSPFGKIAAEKAERASLHRPKFRMALFGDFTGRAARGVVEVGDALANRRPILLDVDTVEDIIEGFATTLVLPVGKDGAGIEVKLKELDDLHPDELYEKIDMFEELNGLRQQLSMGSMAGNAIAQLKEWAAQHATPLKLPKRSVSTSIPANLKLSDFQALIGDTTPRQVEKSPAEDIIARVVGPHIVKAPDEGAPAMLEAVDAALSSAMRLVLHHPDFQAVESLWRSLDMLARRIETDSKLEIVLYDVSAEELAIDLAAQEDLGESGLYHLLKEPLDPEVGEGGFSALFGLYTFEETPPHAELLARIGLVASHVDAPFFAAMSPGYLEVAKEDRHPLTAEAWDKLKDLPEAAYLGLSSPRFLLRLPYGQKTEPCYEFDFEEFTPSEGLSGMLWCNPVVLVAVLLAATYKKDGKAMDLGSLMSLGDMPFYYMTDRYGDQVALPCTERNLTSDKAQHTLMRGFMPVLWVKGRNEVRLGSFRSLGGDEIQGPWAGQELAPRKTPGRAAPEMEVDAEIELDADAGDTGADDTDDTDLDALLADLGGDDDDGGESLDDLLAGFDDDAELSDGDDDEMDAELAALLEGL